MQLDSDYIGFTRKKIFRHSVLLATIILIIANSYSAYSKGIFDFSSFKSYVISKKKLIDSRGVAFQNNSLIDTNNTFLEYVDSFSDSLALINSEKIIDYLYDNYKESGFLYELLRDYYYRSNKYEHYNKYTELGISKKYIKIKNKRMHYSNLGFSYLHTGEYKKALYCYNLTLENLDKNSKKYYIDYANCLTNIGHIYSEQKEYDKAIYFHQKSIEFCLGGKNCEEEDLRWIYNNIGQTYMCQKDTVRAEEYFDKSIQSFKIMIKSYPHRNEDYRSSIIYPKLNKIICNLKEEDADSLANEILDIIEVLLEFNKYRGLAKSYYVLGNLYAFHQDADSAKLWYSNALKIAQNNGYDEITKELTYEAYNGLKSIEEFEEATKYIDEYNRVNEKIYTKDLNGKLADMQVEFQTKEKENEILKLKLTNQSNRLIIIFVVVLLVSVVIVTLIIYRNNYKIRLINTQTQQQKLTIEKQHKELKESEYIKDRFYSVLTHDLKNSLLTSGIIIEKISQKVNFKEDSKEKYWFENLLKSNIDVTNLLENLVEWIQIQSGTKKSYPVKVEVNEIINTIIKNNDLLAKNKSIDVQNHINKNICVLFDKRMLYSIIQNLFNNAIKYTKEGGLIEIGYQISDKHSKIYVSDNGIGMTDEQISNLKESNFNNYTNGTYMEVGNGFGLKICFDFIKLNNSEIEIESTLDQGSKFTIVIPTKD